MLASIDLSVDSFIVEANVNILTSLLFLKRKPEEVFKAEVLGQKKDCPAFMAVAEKVNCGWASWMLPLNRDHCRAPALQFAKLAS